MERLASARLSGLDEASVTAAKVELGLAANLPVLLVTGGSLGAARLNAAVVGALADLVGHTNIVHLTGKGKSVEPLRARAGLPEDLRGRYLAQEYSTDITSLFAIADLVLARAGAGTVAELTALGLPAVYVPLPIGNGEQERNIADVVAAGGGVHVRDAQLTADWIRDELAPLIGDRMRLATMGRAARSTGRVDATAELVRIVERIGSGDRGGHRRPPTTRRIRNDRRPRAAG